MGEKFTMARKARHMRDPQSHHDEQMRLQDRIAVMVQWINAGIIKVENPKGHGRGQPITIVVGSEVFEAVNDKQYPTELLVARIGLAIQAGHTCVVPLSMEALSKARRTEYAKQLSISTQTFLDEAASFPHQALEDKFVREMTARVNIELLNAMLYGAAKAKGNHP